jgi:hypothetical protein
MPRVEGWELFHEKSNEIVWHSLGKASKVLAYKNVYGKRFPIPQYILRVEKIRPNLASNRFLWEVRLGGWKST